MAYDGGPVIKQALVQLIFAGSSWSASDGKALAANIHHSLKRLLAGPYMWGLSQYSGILPGSLVEHDVFDPTEPTAPVTFDSVGERLGTLIPSGNISDFRINDQILYIVFTQGVQFKDPMALGFHNYDEIDGSRFHYAWINAITLDVATYAASHELVEACTDPEINGYGWIIKTASGNVREEVADLCEIPEFSYSEGIVAAPYWSDLDGACICPSRSFKLWIDRDECDIGPTMGSTSVVNAAYVGLQPEWLTGSELPPLTGFTYYWEDAYEVYYPGSRTGLMATVSWWLPNDFYTTTIWFVATADNGTQLRASITVSPRSPLQAQAAALACRIRKMRNNINRIPPFIIDRFGPDGPPMPSDADFRAIRSELQKTQALTDHLEKIMLLAKREKRQRAREVPVPSFTAKANYPTPPRVQINH